MESEADTVPDVEDGVQEQALIVEQRIDNAVFVEHYTTRAAATSAIVDLLAAADVRRDRKNLSGALSYYQKAIVAIDQCKAADIDVSSTVARDVFAKQFGTCRLLHGEDSPETMRAKDLLASHVYSQAQPVTGSVDVAAVAAASPLGARCWWR